MRSELKCVLGKHAVSTAPLTVLQKGSTSRPLHSAVVKKRARNYGRCASCKSACSLQPFFAGAKVSSNIGTTYKTEEASEHGRQSIDTGTLLTVVKDSANSAMKTLAFSCEENYTTGTERGLREVTVFPP